MGALGIMVVCAALAGVPVAVGQVRSGAEEASALATQAMSLARAGRAAESETLIKQALRLQPGDPALLAMLGNVLGMQGKSDEANDAFSRAVRLDPSDRASRRSLAAGQWQSGRLSQARENIEIVLAASPNDPTSLLLAGMIAENMGDYAAAASRLEQAGHLVYERAESVLALTRALYSLERVDDARRALGELGSLRASAAHLETAGTIAFEAHDYESASKFFDAARAGHRQWGRLTFNLALSLYRMGRFAPARHATEELLSREPESGEAWNLLGWCLEKSGDSDRAAAALQRAVAVEPESEKHHLDLGLVLARRRGTWHLAMETAERAVERFPDSFRSHQLKGLVHVRQQHFLDAVKAYERALDLGPDSAEVRLALTVALRASGLHGRALEMARESTVRFPGDAALRHQLARMHLDRAERGDLSGEEGGLALLRETLALDPDFAEAHYDLGSLHLRRGEFQQALASLRRAAELAPASRRTHYALARCWRRLGRPDQAAQALQAFRQLTEPEEAAEPIGVTR